MGKEDPPPPPPEKKPKKKPSDPRPCKTCGKDLRLHTIHELAACAAATN